MDIWTEGSYTAEDVLEPSAADLETCDLDFVQTTRSVAKQLAARGHYGKAETILRTLLEAQERVYGPDDPDFLRANYELSLVLNEVERFDEARSLLQDLVPNRRRVLGPNHPHTLNAMGLLADTHRYLELYDEAQPLYEETLLRLEEQFGPVNYRTLIIRHNFALLYAAQARHKDAEPVFQDCLENLEAQCDPYDKNLLVVKQNFGKNQNHLGNDAVAERVWRDALEGMVQSLGAENPTTVDLMTTVAWFYEKNGRFDDALPLYKQIIEATEMTRGTDHDSTILAHMDVARVYSHMENYSEALPRAKATVDALTNILNNRGLESTGRLERAKESRNRTTIYDLLEAQQLLGRCYHFTNQFDESEQLYSELISSLQHQQSTDSEFPGVMLPCAQQCMGELLSELERCDEAEAFMKQALAGHEGSNHEGSGYRSKLCMVELGSVLHRLGKSAESAAMLQNATQPSNGPRGISELQTADISVKVALFYEDIEDWAGGYTFMMMALEVREEKHGKGSRSTLVPLQGLGLCSELLGKTEEAVEWYERAIVGMEKVYGFHFGDLLQVITRWSGCCFKLGRGDECLPRIEQYREQGVHFVLMGPNGTSDTTSDEEQTACVDQEEQDGPALRDKSVGMMGRYPVTSKHLRSKL